MQRKVGVLLALIGLLSAGQVLTAHHSFSVEYSQEKPVKLTGVVTKVEWTNPHARFYIDVVGDKGATTNWNIELAAVSALRRNGWTSRSLNVGDTVTVEGFGSIQDFPRASAGSVVLGSGRSLFAGANDQQY